MSLTLGCDGVISDDGAGDLTCSTGWVAVDVPFYQPLTIDDFDYLSSSMIVIFVIAFGVKMVKSVFM